MTHPYLVAAPPVAFAHRGGAREAPENSLRAFHRAVSLGFEYIETDIRATADGVPVVFHDQSLQRVTDRVGRIRDLPFSEVKKAHIGNAERVHSLREVLDKFPRTRFNIDIKEDNAVAPILELLGESDFLDRICVASFSWARLRAVRAKFGQAVCTSLAPQEISALVSRSRLGRVSFASRLALPKGPACVQVPRRASRVPIITASLVRHAHERGWPVHAWTINDPMQMNALLDIGVDGIVTDRPSVLRQVIDGRSRSNVSGVSNAPGRGAPGVSEPPS
ncbi:MAG: glycerophosphodiester phosphodiesterase [Candidatus Nanopelagicales bacterium]